MKRNILLFSILLTLLILLSRQVSAQTPVVKNPVLNPVPNIEISSKKLDSRAKVLAEYLSKYDSPLQYHAQDFIDASEAYNLDWKMLPAIAGVESTFGKHIPGGYNGWGWGVYGTQAIYFSSWKEAIFTIARGLRENYLNKGLTNPYSINRIYAASPTWGSRVDYFMQDLEDFAKESQANAAQAAQITESPKIAAISGQIASR